MDAIDVCAGGIGGIESFWGGWVGSCFLAITVSIFILAFLYMIGKAFRHPKLGAWVRDEFGQLLATAVLVLMIVGLVGFMCSFSPVFLDDRYAGKNMYEVADDYLRDLRDRIVVAMGLTYTMNVFVDFMQSPVYEATPTGIGITTQTLAGLAPLLQGLSVLLTALTTALLTVAAQITILEYIKIAMLGYLLPVGVLLRCFEPTRVFGGAMIGLSVGLFLFYPFLLVFNDLIIHESLVKAQEESEREVGVVSNPEFDSEGNPNPDYDPDKPIADGKVVTPLAVARLMGRTVKDMFKAGFGLKQGFIATIFAPIMGPISVLVGFAFNLLIAVLVLGMLNFIILITMIRDLSRILGEEVDVTNLTRMI